MVNQKVNEKVDKWILIPKSGYVRGQSKTKRKSELVHFILKVRIYTRPPKKLEFAFFSQT